MKLILNVSIPGPPVGKCRPRAQIVWKNGKPMAHIYTPTKSDKWEKRAGFIMLANHEGWAVSAPMKLVVRAVVKRPQRLNRRKDPPGRVQRTAKPDTDNVIKAVADALQKGGVIVDDRFIVEWHGFSLYAAKEEGPCVEVELYELEGAEAVNGELL